MRRATFLLVALCLLACSKAEPEDRPAPSKIRTPPSAVFAKSAPRGAPAPLVEGAVPVNVMREPTGYRKPFGPRPAFSTAGFSLSGAAGLVTRPLAST